MKQLLFLASAAALTAAAPAHSKPDHAKGGPHAHHVNGPVGYGAGGCPPGLAKKSNGCLPPGQSKKLYNVGQRLPTGYGYPWQYNQIPYDLRNHYGFDPRSNYYYGDGYLYRVDPRTMVISQIVSAILR